MWGGEVVRSLCHKESEEAMKPPDFGRARGGGGLVPPD